MKLVWKLKLGLKLQLSVRAPEVRIDNGEATFGLVSDVFYTALKFV